MHVAMVHMRHAGVGGTEQILDRFAAWMAGHGHEVTIVCRSHEQAPHPSVRFVVLRRFAPGAAARMWAFARDVERHVAGANYDIVLGLGKTWTHDVVRTGGGSHQTYLDVSAIHGGGKQGLLGGRRLKDRLAIRIEARAYQPGAYRKVVANSHMVARDMTARYGVKAEDLTVIYNGVDLPRFGPDARPRGAELRRELGLSAEDRVLLFLGAGFRRKGLMRLLDALPAVVAQHEDVRLLVVGGDASRAACERHVAESGLGDKVLFLGRRRDPEACYAASDLFILPTYYDSFGFVVLEAMASGVPVITTDRAGASELIEPGVTGAVLPGACEADEIAIAVSEWCTSERLAEAGPAARLCAEQYGFERTFAEFEAVLTGLGVPAHAV